MYIYIFNWQSIGTSFHNLYMYYYLFIQCIKCNSLNTAISRQLWSVQIADANIKINSCFEFVRCSLLSFFPKSCLDLIWQIAFCVWMKIVFIVKFWIGGCVYFRHFYLSLNVGYLVEDNLLMKFPGDFLLVEYYIIYLG